MMEKMSRKQRSLLVLFFIVAFLLLIIVGGFYAVKRYYPLEYKTVINEYSEKNGLDPYFVLAIVNTESRFDKDAESHVGAKGLMHLMPETGEWIASKIGEEIAEAALTDAETNIRYGTWYLRYLLDMYGGDEICAMAAYNAGHSNVDKWLTEIPLDGSIDPELIPFEETRNYVKKVNIAYEIYKALYPDI